MRSRSSSAEARPACRSAAKTTLPLARKLATSAKPSAAKCARSSSLVTRWPPTFIPRRNAAYDAMAEPYSGDQHARAPFSHGSRQCARKVRRANFWPHATKVRLDSGLEAFPSRPREVDHVRDARAHEVLPGRPRCDGQVWSGDG